MQVVAQRGPSFGHCFGGETCRQLRALGMHRHRQPERRRTRHSRPQCLVVRGRKVVDSGGAHECLEADHATVRELVEPIDVARDEAAPEREVDVCRPRGDRELEVERGSVERRRARVQRHVGERRRAACCERLRAVVEPLPVGPAGIVAVHVRVDDAGEDVEPRGVDRLLRATLEVGADLGDQPVADADVTTL